MRDKGPTPKEVRVHIRQRSEILAGAGAFATKGMSLLVAAARASLIRIKIKLVTNVRMVARENLLKNGNISIR